MHGLILKTSICYWQDQPDIPIRLEIIIFLFISPQERTNLPPIIRFPFIRLVVISFLRYLIAKQIAILDRITHSLAHLCAWNLMASPSYCPRVVSMNGPLQSINHYFPIGMSGLFSVKISVNGRPTA